MKKAKGTRVVDLTVMQRMNLLRMLPVQGKNMLTVRAIVELQELLNLSGEEVQSLGLEHATSTLQLTPEQQVATLRIEFSGTAWGIIRDSITDLEKAGTLPATKVMIELWEIFMETAPTLVEDQEEDPEE